MKITKILLIILVLFAAQAAAQEATEKLPPHVRTTGEAVVTVKPDRAQIDIGVVTQSESSQAAAVANAKQLEATLSRLRQLLGANADIKTISYTINPNYRYPKEGGEPTITGYTATNVVRVTLDDLTKVGQVIDTATAAGANRIQNLQFTLKNDLVVQAQALQQAAARARAKAEAMAGALNLNMVRVLSVVESSPAVVPMYDVAMARAETARTPIEPGTIEVRATVTLTVEVRAR